MSHTHEIKSENIVKAEQEMGFAADVVMDLREAPMTPDDGALKYQRHVAIEWNGGVLWLNFFDFSHMHEQKPENNHFCIDVRQFNSAGAVKGQGVFTMSRNAQRGSIPDDPEGNVQGHNWNGGYVIAILTDPDGQESHTEKERDDR